MTVVPQDQSSADGVAIEARGLTRDFDHFRAVDQVGIGTVPGWTPAQFPKPAGAMAGYIERFSWATAPQAVEFSRTWFDTDRALYVQRLK